MSRTAAMTVLCLIALSGCSSSSGSTDFADSATEIESAYNSCADTVSVPVGEVADDGHTLLLDVKDSDEYEGFGCLLGSLDTPESLMASIASTTAMMGRQTEEANGFTYEWSYHPDNGTNMVITD